MSCFWNSRKEVCEEEAEHAAGAVRAHAKAPQVPGAGGRGQVPGTGGRGQVPGDALTGVLENVLDQRPEASCSPPISHVNGAAVRGS